MKGLYKIENGYIVIKYPIEVRNAKAGRNVLIAATAGAETFNHEGKEIRVNLNAYMDWKDWRDLN